MTQMKGKKWMYKHKVTWVQQKYKKPEYSTLVNLLSDGYRTNCVFSVMWCIKMLLPSLEQRYKDNINQGMTNTGHICICFIAVAWTVSLPANLTVGFSGTALAGPRSLSVRVWVNTSAGRLLAFASSSLSLLRLWLKPLHSIFSHCCHSWFIKSLSRSRKAFSRSVENILKVYS